MADESYLLGPGPAPESYLNVEKILEVASQVGRRGDPPRIRLPGRERGLREGLREGRDGVHRPAPEAIEAMGSKTRAREMMKEAGVPIVPGTTEPVASLKEAKPIAAEIGYPVAVEGGRRRRRQGLPGRDVARTSSRRRSRAPAARGRSSSPTRPSTWSATSRTRATSRSRCWRTAHGNVVHLGERDCSVQRRHQKLIEETPAPGVDEEFRERIGKIATDAAAAIGYRSAGTIEGLLARDEDGEPEYFFLEMNTRVQVEHTVTEMATGIDIVREQIRIAAGEPISFAQEDVEHPRLGRSSAGSTPRPPTRSSRPRPGTITTLLASRRGRACGSTRASRRAPRSRPLYDPMVAKLIVWDRDREAATARMLRALDEFEIGGAHDPDPLPQGAAGAPSSGSSARDLPGPGRGPEVAQVAGARAAARRRPRSEEEGEKVERDYTVEVDGRRFSVKVIGPPPAGGVGRRGELGRRPSGRAAARARRRRRIGRRRQRALVSPLQGTVLQGRTSRRAQEVEAGAVDLRDRGDEDGERDHRPPLAGKVEELNVSEGGAVAAGDTIAVIK